MRNIYIYRGRESDIAKAKERVVVREKRERERVCVVGKQKRKGGVCVRGRTGKKGEARVELEN